MKGLPKRAGAFLFGIHQAGFPGEVYLPPFYILRPGERRKERIAVQYPENAPPQIRSPADSIVANHVIIGRPGLYAKEETRSKGLKI